MKEEIYKKITELFISNSKNKKIYFLLNKKYTSNGNKTNWDDGESYSFECEDDDIEFTIKKTITYREPNVYGEKLDEITYYDLVRLKNIDELDILSYLKFKSRKTKIANLFNKR